MSKIILVVGQTGAGKTSYSIKLSDKIKGIRFSIDPWMQNLFAKDMVNLDFEWMMERVNRCQVQMWDITSQILRFDGIVILDLGFTTYEQRKFFIDKAKKVNAAVEIHFLDVATEIRKQRVEKRNREKDPAVYSFEVTDFMFNFMEPRFEAPQDDELDYLIRI